jgi:hypothetical protein
LFVVSLLLSCAPGETKAGLGPNEPSPIVQLNISPSNASVHTDETLTFSALGVHQDGSTSAPPVTWSVTGGAISQTGVYTPAAATGTFAVTASVSGGSVTASAPVTVLPATSPIVNLTMSPGSASLYTGGTQPFVVTAARQDGSTLSPSVMWSATGGTVSSGGLYTAGGTAGTFRVIAVLLGGTLADTSAVTISTPVLQAVILSPASSSVILGGTRQFSVSGQWNNGATTAPVVTYSATGGSITAGGLYTAGGTAGTFRVIATEQGGSLADTSVVTLTVAPPPSMFFNSSEPGGDGSNPNYLLADDFDDGDWYSKDCDQANASGGLLQTDGWCGNIYENPSTPAGAAVCGGVGFGGSNCAASSGYMNGTAGGRNMAEHGFSGGNLNEAYFRLYFQPQADYLGGHEKMFDFTRGGETGQMVALCYNYFGGETIRCIPYLHQDDGIASQPGNGWMGSNMGSTVSLIPTHWYFIEMHVRLNTPGVYDGVFEMWLNDCGVNGTSCTGAPTLRSRYTNVLYRSAAESNITLGGIWIENWANPGSTGNLFYDNVVVSKAGIGFRQ